MTDLRRDDPSASPEPDPLPPLRRAAVRFRDSDRRNPYQREREERRKLWGLPGAPHSALSNFFFDG